MRVGLAVVLIIAAASYGCSGGVDEKTAAESAVPGVRIEKLALTQTDEIYEATGTVRSRTSSVLSSKILGNVTSIKVREGDPVRQGQLLIEIDNRDAVAQLRGAEAVLREAEEGLDEVERSIAGARSARDAAVANRQLADATFERYRTLFERRSVSPQEYDEAQARQRVAAAEAERAERMLDTLAAKKKQVLAKIDQAKAAVAAAQVFVGYGRITSPITGVVTAKHTDIGQTASPGSPLLTVENATSFRLEASVEESQLAHVRLGDAVAVHVDSLDGELEGRVGEIVPSAESASRSFTVKVDLPGDANRGLRSGLFGRARFVTGQRQALLVPRAALSERGQLTAVYSVDESGIARLRLIKTGRTHGDMVEVLSGLKEGEEIVVANVEAVADGRKVR